MLRVSDEDSPLVSRLADVRGFGATLRGLTRRRTFAPLADMPLGARLLASGAISAGALMASIRPRRAARGAVEGDAVVSIGKLGDHVRMLNVLSRMRRANGKPLPDVFANSTAAGLEGLFEGVRLRVNGGRHGASYLVPSLRERFRDPAFARALVIQPMIQAPLAIAYGKAIAARVLANGDGIVQGIDRVPLDTRSWRDAYASFLEAAYPDATFGPSPVVAPRLRRDAAAGGSEVVLHPAGTTHPRGLEPEVFVRVARALRDRGLRPVVVGSADEASALHALFGDVVAYAIGESLSELASRLTRARALIGVDSSVMNVADAVGTPSVIAYTTSDPAACGPFYAPAVAVVDPGMTGLGVDPEIVWSRATNGRRPVVRAEDLLNAFDRLLALAR